MESGQNANHVKPFIHCDHPEQGDVAGIFPLLSMNDLTYLHVTTGQCAAAITLYATLIRGWNPGRKAPLIPIAIKSAFVSRATCRIISTVSPDSIKNCGFSGSSCGLKMPTILS